MSGKRVVVIDIETVSSATESTRAAIDEMARAANRDPEAFAALSPALARVVAVGMEDIESGKQRCLFDASLFAGDGATVPGDGAVPCDGERELLRAVDEKVSKSVARVVTFNGRSFDLPVLVHRMVAHGLKPSDFLLAALRQPRYKGAGAHVDLREQFTMQGAVNGGCSLRAFAVGYGFDDPKAGGCGSDVAALVAAKDARSLTSYCLGDVRVTARLYERWADCVGVA